MLAAQTVVLASSVGRYGGGLTGLIIVLLLAFVSSRVASSKGRSPVLWFILGFFFPVIALIVVFLLPRKS